MHIYPFCIFVYNGYMRPSFTSYSKQFLHNSFDAVVNVGLFLPYFFSIPTLMRTLFAPWKNIVSHKTEVGFSISSMFDRLAQDGVSRGMGFFMRSSLIAFYLILQLSYMFVMPVFFIGIVLYLPLGYVLSLVTKTEYEKKEIAKTKFLNTHLLDDANRVQVEEWFESYYLRNYREQNWWQLSYLYSIPPMARDWTKGYTPNLDQFSQDLCTAAYQQNLTHIVGRQKEVDQIERILSKSEEANVVIVGDEGVGKHTIVDAFAKKIYEGKTNTLLMYKRILKLNMSKILTQYQDQQKREEFVSELFIEAAVSKNIIIFIENLDLYVSGVGDRVDLTVAIEKFAKTNALQIIGSTSPFLYQKYIFQNEKINRIFSKVDVYEIGKEEALSILMNNVEHFEYRYGLSVPYETLVETITKSDFYITAIPFPEKALQLIDLACVQVAQAHSKSYITPENIDTVLTEKTHIPMSLSESVKQKLLSLEALLTEHIVDQAEAITQVSSTLRRAFLLIGKRKKPIASFMFLGPTGVGKTETAKAIAKVFFEDQNSAEDHMLRFDMSMFQSQSDIEKLVGSIETGDPGLLTKSIRENPYGVLLLDEIEKADKNLLNIFLSILDEGYYTDGFGKRVDCKNLIIIATSNAGAQEVAKNSERLPLQQKLVNILIELRIFAPEFLNRFDGIVAFKPLENEGAMSLAQKMLASIAAEIESMYKVHLVVSPQTLQDIVKKSYDPRFGARDMDRILRSQIEDKIATLLLTNQAHDGQTLTL